MSICQFLGGGLLLLCRVSYRRVWRASNNRYPLTSLSLMLTKYISQSSDLGPHIDGQQVAIGRYRKTGRLSILGYESLLAE
jgi:hypothetical protein